MTIGGPSRLLLAPDVRVERWSRPHRQFLDAPLVDGQVLVGPADLVSVTVGQSCRSTDWLGPVADRVVRFSVEGEIPGARRWLGEMVRLRALLLKGSCWTDDELVHVPSSVRELMLFATRVSGAGLRSLASGRLRNLSVSAHAGPRPFTDDDVIDLCEDGPALQFFCPWATDVTDQALEPIASVRGLQTLGLAHTKVNGSGFRHLLAARSLRVLRLDHTALESVHLAVLGEHPTLERIGLMGVSFTGEPDLGALLKAPRLTSVVLRGDELPEEDIRWIRERMAERRSSTTR